MTRSALASTAALLLLSASAALHAQMPTDNDTWKARCGALSASVDLNHLSPTVIALTRGIPGSKFITFAFDRDAAAQHNVACTLFFLGAVANQAGNGGKPDPSAAQDAQTLANLQLKAIHNQDVSFSESLTRMKAKAVEITRPALSVADEEAIVAAATTIPYRNLAEQATNSPHGGQ